MLLIGSISAALSVLPVGKGKERGLISPTAAGNGAHIICV